MNTPSSFRIYAFKTSTVLAFKKSIIQEYIEKDPILAKFYYERIIHAFVTQQKLRVKLLTLNSKQFFLYLRSLYPEIFLAVPSVHLAKFMKITPQWLSKLKKEA